MGILPTASATLTIQVTGWVKSGVFAAGFILALALVVVLQQNLDRRIDRGVTQIEELAQLPRGEYLKPAMLGYHHLGADVLWLRLLQVLGKKNSTADEYAWIYHALDIVTTLDPQYAYAYYVGGVALTNLAERVDLSNRLLEKGHRENPNEWNLPFLLGYNHYFVLGDPAKGAEYIDRAARIPGGPAFLPGLSTRMYAEAGNPDVALAFLDALWKETSDPHMRAELANRAKEVTIERDIRNIEAAVEQYRKKQGRPPAGLQDLTKQGYLTHLPQEPFGGSYQIDSQAGTVTSSSRPKRLKVLRPDKSGGV